MGKGGEDGCRYRVKMTYLKTVLEVKFMGLDDLLNMAGGWGKGNREVKDDSHFSSLTD